MLVVFYQTARRVLDEGAKGILIIVSRSEGPHEEKRKTAFGRREVGRNSCTENVEHLSAHAVTRLGKTVPHVCSCFTHGRDRPWHSQARTCESWIQREETISSFTDDWMFCFLLGEKGPNEITGEGQYPPVSILRLLPGPSWGESQ